MEGGRTPSDLGCPQWGGTPPQGQAANAAVASFTEPLWSPHSALDKPPRHTHASPRQHKQLLHSPRYRWHLMELPLYPLCRSSHLQQVSLATYFCSDPSVLHKDEADINKAFTWVSHGKKKKWLQHWFTLIELLSDCTRVLRGGNVIGPSVQSSVELLKTKVDRVIHPSVSQTKDYPWITQPKHLMVGYAKCVKTDDRNPPWFVNLIRASEIPCGTRQVGEFIIQ